MRVFDILNEATIDSAQALKASFTPAQWANIVRSIKKDELNKTKTAIERENKISKYNKEFGLEFYTQDPTRWMSVAKLNGVNIPTIVRTWQDVYDFLATHTQPVELTAATPDPNAQNNDQDNTPETFAEIQGWIVGPPDGIFVKKDPEPDPNELKPYIDGFIGKLVRTRGNKYKEELKRNNFKNTMWGNYIAAANKIQADYDTANITNVEGATITGVTKKFVDTQLYGMMISIDTIFAATQASPQ
tara:strand:- start:2068 stop:2802 length:735 start_codon:yes stop_codon:yes gene_type:complete